MAKQGMKKPEITEGRKKNSQLPVPEIQGRAKRGHEKAKPMIAGTEGPYQKVYHTRPFSVSYHQLDNDLARENLENDIPFADLQDL